MKNVQRLQSGLLREAGITHGWFMRYGGVSEGLFESLNGKKGNGDLEHNVDENRKRALAGLCHPALDSGAVCSKSACLRKSSNIAFITHSFKTRINVFSKPGEYTDFDGSIARTKNVVLAHATADCGSIIIASCDRKAVALVHGSWHTLRDKIICDVIAKMKKYSSAELVAGIGPMICCNCYEFGSEASSLFDKKYIKVFDTRGFSSANQSNTTGRTRGALNVKDRLAYEQLHTEKNLPKPKDSQPKKYFVDLKQMVVDQLNEAGVFRIDDLAICTKEDNRFFSHRRGGRSSGRFLTLASITDVI